MAKVNPEIESFARIKVIGIGGSGKGALNHMINSKLQGVEFIIHSLRRRFISEKT
jgi:cell division protein FtsZ